VLFRTDAPRRTQVVYSKILIFAVWTSGPPEPKMKIVAKSRMAMLLLTLASSAALLAQSGGSSPDNPQNQRDLDARQIVAASIAATEHSWQARGYYTYTERDENRRLDARGQMKSDDVDVSRMIVVNGARFEQLLEHNGNPPSTEERKKQDEGLEKLKHETPDARATRLRKDQENKSFLGEIPSAFDFQLVGEEIADGRPAYVFQATPHTRAIRHAAGTARCSRRWMASFGLTSRTLGGSRWTAR